MFYQIKFDEVVTNKACKILEITEISVWNFVVSNFKLWVSNILTIKHYVFCLENYTDGLIDFLAFRQ